MVNASQYNPDYDFVIEGVCYVGAPKPRRAAYAKKKLEALLHCLWDVEQCLVFISRDVVVPKGLEQKHCFVRADDPAVAYARLSEALWQAEQARWKSRRYTLTPEGWRRGENVVLGDNVRIEPGALIDHDVTIGANTTVLAGAVVRHAVVGEGCTIKEYAVVGDDGFNPYREAEGGDLLQLHCLGDVQIGAHVAIGAHTTVGRSTASSTVVGDHTKLDNHIHIGHDAQLGRSVTITAGCTIGGYCDIGDHVYIGVGAALRNRITIGEKARIGMGSTVIHDVAPDTTVVGNPARLLPEK